MAPTRDWADLDGVLGATAEFFTGPRPSAEQFLEFARRERLFATLLTPIAEADGDPDKRWDSARICAMSELLGWYGLPFLEVWQAAIVATCAIWQSDCSAARRHAAARLEQGATFALALQERAWSGPNNSSLLLTPRPGGGYLARGGKYHAGRSADAVAVFGRRADSPGPAGRVLFLLDTAHLACQVDRAAGVTELELDDYPVGVDDVLCTGPDALLAAHHALNIGQLTLGFGVVGMCDHALRDAVSVSTTRVVGERPLSSYANVRRRLVESFGRVTAMRLFVTRATDYVRSARADDQRYLLHVLVARVVILEESQRVVETLLDVVEPQFDVIGGRGLGARATDEPAWRALIRPGVEAKFHLHKFMVNYMLRPTDRCPAVPARRDAGEDAFVLHPAPPPSYRELRFQDWRAAYRDFGGLANVALLAEQAEGLAALLAVAPLSAAQRQDLDYLDALRAMFTVVVYGQLVLEQARLSGTDVGMVDQAFEGLVADFSGHAVTFHGQPLAEPAQRKLALDHVRRPQADARRQAAIWDAMVHGS